MLLLPLLALAASWSDGQAQVVLKQTKASITRSQGTTARIQCAVEGISNFQSTYIHWYRQLPSQAPQRILYIGADPAIYDDSSYSNKYSSLKQDKNVCVFLVNDISSNDEGTYYCACW
ncbi:TVC1 protein, partial [Bucco capensis]|nr:TVC1 protein [Bucco capensis]